MKRELYIVTKTVESLWFGERPPTEDEMREATEIERERFEWDVGCFLPFGWTKGSIVYGPSEDVTVQEAMAEADR